MKWGIRQVPALFCLALIGLYRVAVSPFLGRNCRFYPCCSVYAMAVIRQHGMLRGGWLVLRRLLRCHPFCEGGVDLPPERGVGSSFSRPISGDFFRESD